MGLNLHTYTYTHKIQAQILPYQTDQHYSKRYSKKYIYYSKPDKICLPGGQFVVVVVGF